jgi:hypothetical protein
MGMPVGACEKPGIQEYRALGNFTERNSEARQAQPGFGGKRLLTMANLAPHLSLFPTDLSSTLACLLNAHQPCAPVIGCFLWKSLTTHSRVGRKG